MAIYFNLFKFQRMAKHLNQMYNNAIGNNNFALTYAFRIERIRSHIHFLKRCLKEDLIPKGLRVVDKFCNTLKEVDTSLILRKHSRQWMRLAIHGLYTKLSLVSRPMVFTFADSEKIERYKYFLRVVKRNKLQNLYSESDSQRYQPSVSIKLKQPFKNLSSKKFQCGTIGDSGERTVLRASSQAD